MQPASPTALKWEKVYVFISSTFNDMHAERDYLVKRVFPDLREWCEQRKLRLIDIDLRWGVTEADAASKRALKVCLQRINDCRPFFLCFVGQRHGWAPGKGGISPDTFQEFPELEQELRSYPNASITELEIRHAIFRPFAWHDPKNAGRVVSYEPARHSFFYLRNPGYLQTLSNAPRQLLTIYTDDVGPDDETKKEEAFRLASRRALDQLRTEIQIPGRLPQPPTQYSVNWREDFETPELSMPLDCPHTDDDNIKRWRETWNRFAHMGLTDSERSIPELKRPEANDYNVALSRGRLSNFLCENAELATVIKQNLHQAILHRFPDRMEVEEPTNLQRELDQQEEFIANSVEGFVERAGDFDQLNQYVKSDSRQLFVLTAQGGMGKSTLLGKWVDKYRRHDAVHARFIGQSDASSTVYSLMRSLLREIKEVYQKLETEIPEDPNELRRSWPDLLKAIGQRGKTLIVIDALNQLESGLSDLTWLPRPLPENIKMIVSFKSEDDQSLRLHEQMKTDSNVWLFEVKPFTERKDRENLVDKYLDQYWKDLDPQLLEALIGSPGAINPLYLKVVLSELRVFGAFANLAEKIRQDFGDDPVSAFHAILHRLESDPAYSAIDTKQAVPLLFGLLAHARHGLFADELIGIFVQALKLPNNDDSRQQVSDTIHLFLRQVRPFLARREGRYDYFYESFKIAAQQHYVAKDVTETLPKRITKDWHRLIADYFENLPTWKEPPKKGRPGDPTKRKVAELPYHLTYAQEWSRLEKTLCNLDFIEAKCSAGMPYELVEDYDSALAAGGLPQELDTTVTHFARFFRAQTHILGKNPVLTFQQAANQQDSTAPAKIANQRMLEEKRPWLRWINKPQAASPCLMTLAGHKDYVSSCAYSPDGRRIVSASTDKTLKTWDAETGKELATLAGHTDYVTSCAYSPDGRRIVSASADKTLKIWDAETCKELATLAGHKDRGIRSGWVSSCAYSPDGRHVVSASWDETLKIWDAENGTELATLAGHTGMVNSCSYSPDGRRIVSTSSDYTLKIWDADTGKELATLARHAHVDSCAYSPDGRRIITASWMELRIWDAETGKEQTTLTGHTHEVRSCSYSPDGRHIVSASADKTLRIWDAETGKELATLGDAEGVSSCTYSPDGRRIVSASWRTLKIWDAELGKELATPAGRTAHVVTSCAYSPNGHRIVSASRDSTLKIWDAETGKELTTLAGHTNSVESCSYSPDGRHIVSGSWGTLKIWDAQTGEELASLGGHPGFVKWCSYSPDGRCIVSIFEDQSWRTLKIWDAETGKELTTLAGHKSSGVNSCAYSPDSSRIVTATSLDLNIWDAETGKELVILAEHTNMVNSCAYSPDGSRIASASKDETLKIWDAETGKLLTTLVGHTRDVSSCAYSPDGRHIVSVSDDNTLRIWNAETGKVLATLPGHKDWVSSCAYSPDGHRIVLASNNKTLTIWDAETSKELATYFVDAQSAAWNPDGSRVVIGTSLGAPHLLKLENISLGLPIITAWRNHNSVALGCPFCRVWSQISESHLGSQFPCPNCGKNVKLTAFTINADWRPIARAWGNK